MGNLEDFGTQAPEGGSCGVAHLKGSRHIVYTEVPKARQQKGGVEKTRSGKADPPRGGEALADPREELGHRVVRAQAPCPLIHPEKIPDVLTVR